MHYHAAHVIIRSPNGDLHSIAATSPVCLMSMASLDRFERLIRESVIGAGIVIQEVVTIYFKHQSEAEQSHKWFVTDMDIISSDTLWRAIKDYADHLKGDVC